MNYAVIEDGICTNVAVCDDPAYAASLGWMDVTDAPQVSAGWTYDGSTWTAPKTLL